MPVNGGVKNWASGEVLDAADLNEFVADQTIARFATIADRTSAYGVSGAPTLQAGMFSWVESTEKLYYYDGTSWEEVGAQVEDGEITEAKLADSAVTSAKIANGTIVDADVNASAAIAHSKLANITAGSVLIGNASNVPTATAVSGDVTVTSSGVTAIGSGVIVNADVNASAAIAYSKLNLANSITTTDLASGAPRAGFRSTQNAQTGTSYTLALTDLGALVELSNASAITLTIPSEATVAFAVGDRIDIVQTGAGQVTIVGATSPNAVTVNAYDGGLKLNGQWAAATLVKRATNTWLAIGNLTT